MNAWIHAHALMAVALAFFTGASAGMLLMGIMAAGKRVNVTPDMGKQDREAQRAIAQLIRETTGRRV